MKKFFACMLLTFLGYSWTCALADEPEIHNNTQKINLIITLDEVNLILEGLDMMPFGQVSVLVRKIRVQKNQQKPITIQDLTSGSRKVIENNDSEFIPDDEDHPSRTEIAWIQGNEGERVFVIEGEELIKIDTVLTEKREKKQFSVNSGTKVLILNFLLEVSGYVEIEILEGKHKSKIGLVLRRECLLKKNEEEEKEIFFKYDDFP